MQNILRQIRFIALIIFGSILTINSTQAMIRAVWGDQDTNPIVKNTLAQIPKIEEEKKSVWHPSHSLPNPKDRDPEQLIYIKQSDKWWGEYLDYEEFHLLICKKHPSTHPPLWVSVPEFNFKESCQTCNNESNSLH